MTTVRYDKGIVDRVARREALAELKDVVLVVSVWGLTTLFLMLASQWPFSVQHPSKFNLLGLGIIGVGAIAAVVVLAASAGRGRLPALLGVVGVALTLAGSGVPMQGTVLSTHALPPPLSADPLLRFYTVQALQTDTALLIAGIVLTVAAALTSIVVTRGGSRIVAMCCQLALLVASGALAVLALTAGSFNVDPVDFTGRPLRRRDRAQGTSQNLRHATCNSRWMHAAAQEAQSIIAFIDLERRLASVGAPSGLRQRTRRAAADEARHARLCCALARHLGEDAPHTVAPEDRPIQRPSPLRGAPRRSEIRRLAVESYVDGTLGEGASARALFAEAEAAADAWISAVLFSIAQDEHRHSELGRDIAAWCASANPTSAGLALRVTRWRVAVRRARASVRSRPGAG